MSAMKRENTKVGARLSMATKCRVVLVGTYKGDQLVRWRGWYNWPISDKDEISEAEASLINELWLFQENKLLKVYKAKFVGIKTREELISDYGYPATGKAHGKKYLLFQTELQYSHNLDEQGEIYRVIVRTRDFATSPKVRKELKAFLESSDRSNLEIAKLLPGIIAQIPSERLCVGENAVQMTFWDIPDLKLVLKTKVPFPPPESPRFTFIDLFAGVGGIRMGFQNAGGECVFSSEWNEEAAKTYNCNFGEYPQGDITKIAVDSIPDFDVLLAGFPCQPFSISGKMKGFADTRGTLFFDVCRIIEQKRPKVVFLENVKHLVHHDKGRTLSVILQKLENFGYKVSWKVLNGSDFGVPQNRERIIIIGSFDVLFDFSRVSIQPKQILADFLDSSGDFEILKPDEYTLIEREESNQSECSKLNVD